LRVEGGAYGASCHFDPYSGGFSFVTYRDPNLQATLDVFDKSAEFLRAAPIGEAELTRNIIGVIGGLDTYRTPDAKGWTSLASCLIGASDEYLQQRREEILCAGAADFRNLADALAELACHANVVVLGAEQAIAQLSAQQGDKLVLTKVI
jgi:Zn-dependent M16 (insulinase) family peptidase